VPVASRRCGQAECARRLRRAVMKMVSFGGLVPCRSHSGCAWWLGHWHQ